MKTIINGFLSNLNDEDKKIYSEIAFFAYDLGYRAKRAKTKDINYVFTNSKTKKHLIKFSYEDEKPKLKMKFYASNNYSSFFHDAVKEAIEIFNYKYTGCYRCGKCNNVPMGYTYVYPEGRKYFRCGNELISLPPLKKNIVPEVLSLIKTQHEYYLSQIQEK